MKRILSLLMIAILITAISLPLYPKKAKAAFVEGAVARVLTTTIGEDVLTAVAEKAGVKLATQSARDMALKRWNMDVTNKIVQEETQAGAITADSQKLRDTQDYFKNLKSSDIVADPANPGFGKVLVDTTLFLTGASIITDSAKAIYDGYQQNKAVQSLSELTDAVASGSVTTTYKGVGSFDDTANGLWWVGWQDWKKYGLDAVDLTKLHYVTLSQIQDIGTSFSTLVTMYYFSGASWVTKQYGQVTFNYPTDGRYVPDFRLDQVTPTIEQTPDTTNVQPWVYNQPNPNVMPQTVPVEVPMPGTDATTLPVPWNAPVPDITVATPPDGGSTDTTPKINWSKLLVALSDFQNVFPFSIPWDFQKLLGVFNVQPVTPVFHINVQKDVFIFNYIIPINYKFDIDFSMFDPIAGIARWGLVIVFDISAILALRRLTPD